MPHVQNNHASSDTQSGTLAVTLNGVSTGNLIAVFAFCYHGPGSVGIASVADDQGNTYAAVDTANPDTAEWFKTFYARNVTGGNLTITVTYTGTPTYRRVIVTEYSGLSTAADVLDAHSISAVTTTWGTGTDVATSGAATTTANGDTVIGFYGQVSDQTLPTAGTGYTSRSTWQNPAGDAWAHEDRVQSNAGSIAATFTPGGANKETVVAMLAFKAAGGGGGGGATYEARPNPRRNRPGRGPYSRGRYYRAVFAGNTRTPQTYSVTLSESVSASDGVSATRTTAPSISESTAVADAVSAVLTAVGALSEAASAADSINSAGSTFGASLAEAAAASDALTSVLSAVTSLSESVTAQDQVSAGNATYPVSISEAASAADQVSSLATLVASLAESVTAQDQVSAGNATYSVSLTESLTLGDVVAAALIAAGGLSESVAASDSVSAGGPQTYNVSIVEAASAADSISAAGAYGLSLAEVVTLLDSLSATGALTSAPLSRTIVVSGPSRVVVVQSGGRTRVFSH